MKIQTETFIEIHSKTAPEFLHALTATSPFFVGVEGTQLYRGESDISRPLLPTAFRVDGMKKLIELNQLEVPGNGTVASSEDTAKVLGAWFHEKMAVAMFYKHANEQSLPLPPLSQEAHVEMLQRTNDASANIRQGIVWPRKEFLPIMALAQHYGFPTRLLDWSGDALASAYFAASRGMKYLKHADRKIGVWQTNSSLLRRTEMPFNDGESATSMHIAVVDAPYAGNPNLSAQKGRFTLVTEKSNQFNETGNVRKSLDQIFKDICMECDSLGKESLLFLPDDFQSSTAFVKHTLPVSESADLLNRLYQLGYKATRLYPGYAACYQTVEELLKIRESIDYPPR